MFTLPFWCIFAVSCESFVRFLCQYQSCQLIFLAAAVGYSVSGLCCAVAKLLLTLYLEFVIISLGATLMSWQEAHKL